MTKPKNLRRILLSLIGLSAPPELRALLPCQSSCHIITGPQSKALRDGQGAQENPWAGLCYLQAPAFHLWMQKPVTEMSPHTKKDLKD